MVVIHGIVEHGDERGRTLGFPTANLRLFDDSIDEGVWVGLIQGDDGRQSIAAVSIGRRRTFYSDDGIKLLEAHLLDFKGNLYGQRLTVQLVVKLRDQRTFSNIYALTDQLRHDVWTARNWAEQHTPWLLPQDKDVVAEAEVADARTA